MTNYFQLNLFVVVIVLLLNISFSSARRTKSYDTRTLELVHVIFRHGDRTPGKESLWKTNPYYNESFYQPYGYSQLTNDGKRRMFDVGRALKKRYEAFLGTKWDIKLLEAWSTDYNRTKMSTSLLLAGLFPPSGCQTWKQGIVWQPIPFNYLPVSQDKELSSWACATVLPLIYNNSEIVNKLKTYDGLINTLIQGSGENVDYISALDLYFGMLIQTQLGFPLENWTQAIFPEPFKTYIVDFYYLESKTIELKTVMAGYLLKKIITDTQNKVNGTLTPPERKMFLYSGHEVNVATMLTSLEAFNLVDVPPYGSYILFEVHKIDGVYGIKMFYQDYQNEEPQALVLPGCQEFCALEQFIKLTKDIIPKSDVECFGSS